MVEDWVLDWRNREIGEVNLTCPELKALFVGFIVRAQFFLLPLSPVNCRDRPKLALRAPVSHVVGNLSLVGPNNV